MSGTTVFPVLTDEMIVQFVDEATLVEKAEWDRWFLIARIINRKPHREYLPFLEKPEPRRSRLAEPRPKDP